MLLCEAAQQGREKQMQRAATAAAAAATRHHSLGWLDLSSYYPGPVAEGEPSHRSHRHHQHHHRQQQQQQQLSAFEAALLKLIRDEADASSRAPALLPLQTLQKLQTLHTQQPNVATDSSHTPAASESVADSAGIALERMPFGVRRAFSTRGIISLWDWQASLLSSAPIVLDRGNALVCLPSGSGKSVAADLLLLHCVLQRGRSAVLALPYQSGVHEKVQTYEGMVLSAGLWVESDDGFSPSPQLPPQQRPTLCVCT
jgi:hypothetical protein